MQITDELYEFVNKTFGGYTYISVIVTALIIIVCTIVVSALVTKLLKKILSKDGSPLPAMTIYINIGRVCV